MTQYAQNPATDTPRELDVLLGEAAAADLPSATLCLRLASALVDRGAEDEALTWLRRFARISTDYSTWQRGAAILKRIQRPERRLAELRFGRVFVAGTYTTGQLTALLPLAGVAAGMELVVSEGSYAQYRQNLLDPGSAAYASQPDFIVLAVHDGAAQLTGGVGEPAATVTAEAERWRSLWLAVRNYSEARVVQHAFAIRPEVPLGNLALKTPASRYAMLHALNAKLGELADDGVHLVDCERLASDVGKVQWFDDRYWDRAKQAVALNCVPQLALQTAVVMAGAAGLNRKCLILDLDNTVWGGVVGEVGLAGLRLGEGDAIGEAFLRLQDYILDLKRKGVILAVVSKNNDSDAREVFERHPEMRIRLNDVAIFLANWETKVENIRQVSRVLNIGLDSLVFLDDNPAERRIVTQMLPQVDVIHLGADPSRYVQTVAAYTGFESSSLTPDDLRRTDQYLARTRASELAESAGSVEDFYRSLEMTAVLGAFDSMRLPRIAQLVNKTNQFNTTGLRLDEQQLWRRAESEECVTLWLELRDNLTNHGLVAVLVAQGSGDVLDIEIFVMSCRVIGRTVERAMLRRLSMEAVSRGYSKLRGVYHPTPKNEVIRGLYPDLGFNAERVEEPCTWLYDIAEAGPVESDYVVEVVNCE